MAGQSLKTPEELQAKAAEYKLKAKILKRSHDRRIKTFSHIVMAGIMLMFFVGVGLGVYVTVFREEPVITTLDYIMKLAYVVSLGYFVKAFGENVAKIVLSAIFGNRVPFADSMDGSEGGIQE